MKFFGFCRRLVLALSMVFLPLAAHAGVAEDVARDFKPVAGVIVMPVQQEGYLIDLDASKGLRTGDLIAVVRPGDKVVHPITGEMLGTLDEVKGILQVTRIKSGYSYARAITEATSIERGDAVRRFENISATFWDYTGKGEAFFADLKAALPTLDWQDYSSAQLNRPQTPSAPAQGGPLLIFVLQYNELSVRGPGFQVLQAYPAPSSLVATAAPQTAPQPTVQAPSAAPAAGPGPVSALQPGAIVRPAPAPAISAAPAAGAIVRQKAEAPEGLWYGPEFTDQVVGVEAADLDGDGQLEIATAFPHRIEIGRNSGGQYQSIAQVDLGFAQKAISLDGVDLDQDGRSELYVTASGGGNLASLVVGHQGGAYRVAKSGISMYFRAVTLPGEGRVLLGQRMGPGKNDFYGSVFRVVNAGGEPGEGAAVDLPSKANLFGFLPMPPAGGKKILAHLTERDRLQVLTTVGDLLWEGEERFGGSEAFIERPDPTLRSETLINTRNVFPQVRIEPGPQGEILVPANEGSRLFGQSRQYKKSRLVAMAWDGHTLREAWHTQPQEGYMADFRLADYDNDGKLEVLTGVVFSREGISSKGRSVLIGYELN
ncbi:hypothetical protein DESUT3_01170 [Desulfuromonas versatilis]|uniref:VCBS repeat-containing protein n=1 Tax=Desulfuromonas versatilis TaxID=2802975 RepID=A0ABM8HR36_9BACT|nr:VCBS repeat-containing protein [Desulfuromonas versatilis]BCR03048.1 hypothetical protein DESUT3_01170 [Desulfuromonas versatilis]